MITNASTQELHLALMVTNEKYGGNLKFRDMKVLSPNRVQFTLTVNNTRGPGHRLSTPRIFDKGKQRRIASACWHAHGDFFDVLLDIREDIWVRTTKLGAAATGNEAAGITITREGGNWVDWEVGLRMFSSMMSDLCECQGGDR